MVKINLFDIVHSVEYKKARARPKYRDLGKLGAQNRPHQPSSMIPPLSNKCLIMTVVLSVPEI